MLHLCQSTYCAFVSLQLLNEKQVAKQTKQDYSNMQNTNNNNTQTKQVSTSTAKQNNQKFQFVNQNKIPQSNYEFMGYNCSDYMWTVRGDDIMNQSAYSMHSGRFNTTVKEAETFISRTINKIMNTGSRLLSHFFDINSGDLRSVDDRSATLLDAPLVIRKYTANYKYVLRYLSSYFESDQNVELWSNFSLALQGALCYLSMDRIVKMISFVVGRIGERYNIDFLKNMKLGAIFLFFYKAACIISILSCFHANHKIIISENPPTMYVAPVLMDFALTKCSTAESTSTVKKLGTSIFKTLMSLNIPADIKAQVHTGSLKAALMYTRSSNNLYFTNFTAACSHSGRRTNPYPDGQGESLEEEMDAKENTSIPQQLNSTSRVMQTLPETCPSSSDVVEEVVDQPLTRSPVQEVKPIKSQEALLNTITKEKIMEIEPDYQDAKEMREIALEDLLESVLMYIMMSSKITQEQYLEMVKSGVLDKMVREKVLPQCFDIAQFYQDEEITALFVRAQYTEQAVLTLMSIHELMVLQCYQEVYNCLDSFISRGGSYMDTLTAKFVTLLKKKRAGGLVQDGVC